MMFWNTDFEEGAACGVNDSWGEEALKCSRPKQRQQRSLLLDLFMLAQKDCLDAKDLCFQ